MSVDPAPPPVKGPGQVIGGPAADGSSPHAVLRSPPPPWGGPGRSVRSGDAPVRGDQDAIDKHPCRGYMGNMCRLRCAVLMDRSNGTFSK